MGELLWTVFWCGLAILGLFLSWPWWVVFILFLLGGFIWIDGDLF